MPELRDAIEFPSPQGNGAVSQVIVIHLFIMCAVA